MSNEIAILTATAASIGFFHTLFGPDHYLPFIVMSRANNWSRIKTMWITFLCGLGHVSSSILLGILGIILGIAITKIEGFEAFRGNIAAWLLIGFGFAYFIWGMKRAIQNKPHEHHHTHLDGITHSHTHAHQKEHAHIHDQKDKKNLTPWILFTIFVFGPCEPLIPILMYPAAKSSIGGVIWITAVFSIVTIATMLSVVLIFQTGINRLAVHKLERFIHAIAGATIFLSGMSIQFLGL